MSAELIHDPIRNETAKMMRAARLPNVSIEPKGFLNKNGKRPDVACSSWPWSGGTTGTRAIDVVTVASVGSIAALGALKSGSDKPFV